MRLFLGTPCVGPFQKALEAVSPALFSTFIKEDENYLKQISYRQELYLGKPVDVLIEMPQLLLSEAHVRSLLQKLIPHFAVDTLPLYIFAYAT
jgi:hypothetical protein